MSDLAAFYQGYIECLNCQAWDRLGQWVAPNVHYNGQAIGVSGYRQMLERDYRQIPDLHFHIILLVADDTWVAACLAFDCTPTGVFLELPVNGQRIQFQEHVFYRFADGKIVEVRSMIDQAAVRAQLASAD